MKLAAFAAALGLALTAGMTHEPHTYAPAITEVSQAPFHSQHGPSMSAGAERSTNLQQLFEHMPAELPQGHVIVVGSRLD